MNIRDIFITLRYKISYGSTVEWYNFWYIVLRKKRKIIPQVASIDETIRKIIDERLLCQPFGDGKCCSPVRTRKSVSRKVIRYWLKD